LDKFEYYVTIEANQVIFDGSITKIKNKREALSAEIEAVQAKVNLTNLKDLLNKWVYLYQINIKINEQLKEQITQFMEAIFEKRTSIGGGMWAGGMMFNNIVIQSDAKAILDEFGVRTTPFKEGYFTTDAIESTSALAYHAVHAGAKIFNLMSVEDLYIYQDRVSGFVINWSTTSMSQILVDPLTIRAKYSVDATGHDAQIVAKLIKKNNYKLNTPSGQILGEKGMWADIAERDVVANTKEVYPGLYVAGMACAAVFGTPRMGPIFGGMLLSGKKLAEELINRLNK
jgi:thiamine thiazole synthase